MKSIITTRSGWGAFLFLLMMCCLLTAFRPVHKNGCANNGILSACNAAISCASCHSGGEGDFDFYLSNFSGGGCYSPSATTIVQAWLRDSTAITSGIQIRVMDASGNDIPVQSIGTNPNWPAVARSWGPVPVVEHPAPGFFQNAVASYAVSFVAPQTGDVTVFAGAVAADNDLRATGDDAACSQIVLCQPVILPPDTIVPDTIISDTITPRRFIPVAYYDLSGRLLNCPPVNKILIAEDKAGFRKKIMIKQ